MPRFDGTGPIGRGPMTGGGRGYCVSAFGGEGASYPGRQDDVAMRRGGRGFRNCFYATGLPGWARAQRGMRAFGGAAVQPSREDETSALKERADYLKDELEAVQARLRDLQK